MKHWGKYMAWCSWKQKWNISIFVCPSAWVCDSNTFPSICFTYPHEKNVFKNTIFIFQNLPRWQAHENGDVPFLLSTTIYIIFTLSAPYHDLTCLCLQCSTFIGKLAPKLHYLCNLIEIRIAKEHATRNFNSPEIENWFNLILATCICPRGTTGILLIPTLSTFPILSAYGTADSVILFDRRRRWFKWVPVVSPGWPQCKKKNVRFICWDLFQAFWPFEDGQNSFG